MMQYFFVFVYVYIMIYLAGPTQWNNRGKHGGFVSAGEDTFHGVWTRVYGQYSISMMDVLFYHMEGSVVVFVACS